MSLPDVAFHTIPTPKSQKFPDMIIMCVCMYKYRCVCVMERTTTLCGICLGLDLVPSSITTNGQSRLKKKSYRLTGYVPTFFSCTILTWVGINQAFSFPPQIIKVKKNESYVREGHVNKIE